MIIVRAASSKQFSWFNFVHRKEEESFSLEQLLLVRNIGGAAVVPISASSFSTSLPGFWFTFAYNPDAQNPDYPRLCGGGCKIGYDSTAGISTPQKVHYSAFHFESASYSVYKEEVQARVATPFLAPLISQKFSSESTRSRHCHCSNAPMDACKVWWPTKWRHPVVNAHTAKTSLWTVGRKSTVTELILLPLPQSPDPSDKPEMVLNLYIQTVTPLQPTLGVWMTFHQDNFRGWTWGRAWEEHRINSAERMGQQQAEGYGTRGSKHAQTSSSVKMGWGRLGLCRLETPEADSEAILRERNFTGYSISPSGEPALEDGATGKEMMRQRDTGCSVRNIDELSVHPHPQ
ncbi:hypothetical protein ARMGADRAFT_1039204 [Armillaria gallica]|uniref:Uncharacterized protein n=1 Tax=Armillaria gallica TaxID=47427 RepID=A0A2H3CQX3_ARMGA|nr:hypothetical protein ARMGADRAFT_1039204 [Armillaria gallica]